MNECIAIAGMHYRWNEFLSAWVTALSAQRVQKMKSRGPKDLQLEYDVFLKEQGFLYLQWVPDVGEKVDIGKAVNFKHLHIDQS